MSKKYARSRRVYEASKIGGEIKCSCGGYYGGGVMIGLLEEDEIAKHMREGCVMTITLTYDPDPHMVDLDGKELPWSWETK